MACEYLLLNGAAINIQDDRGKTALHLATEQGRTFFFLFFFHFLMDESCSDINKNIRPHCSGHTAQVCLLLKHRADQHLKDSEDQEALDIAVREANADIVTL